MNMKIRCWNKKQVLERYKNNSMCWQSRNTWTFTTSMGGNFPEELITGSSTNRAIWSTFRGDKKMSTPNGLYAAWLGANSFFLSLPEKISIVKLYHFALNAYYAFLIEMNLSSLCELIPFCLKVHIMHFLSTLQTDSYCLFESQGNGGENGN